MSGKLEFGYQMRSGHVFEIQRSLDATKMYTLGFHEATVYSKVEADTSFPHHPSLKSSTFKYLQHEKKPTQNPEKEKERQPPQPMTS